MAVTRIVKIDGKGLFSGGLRNDTSLSDIKVQIDTPEASEITIHARSADRITLSRADLLEALGVRENVKSYRQPGIGQTLPQSR